LDDVRLDEMRIEAIEVLLREAGLALELHPSGEEGEPRFVATIVRPGTARELAFAGFGATRAEAVAAVWRTFADAFSRVFGWGQPTPQAQQPEAQGRIERAPRRTPGMRTPQPVDTGLYLVDATWGSIGPIEVAPGVRTVGELEVIDHIEVENAGALVEAVTGFLASAVASTVPA